LENVLFYSHFPLFNHQIIKLIKQLNNKQKTLNANLNSLPGIPLRLTSNNPVKKVDGIKAINIGVVIIIPINQLNIK